jgi:hypothetical protein
MSVEPLSVDVPPQWHVGVYAEWAFIFSESGYDLTLGFAQLVPGPDQKTTAIVVARVKNDAGVRARAARMIVDQVETITSGASRMPTMILERAARGHSGRR